MNFYEDWIDFKDDCIFLEWLPNNLREMANRREDSQLEKCLESLKTRHRWRHRVTGVDSLHHRKRRRSYKRPHLHTYCEFVSADWLFYRLLITWLELIELFDYIFLFESLWRIHWTLFEWMIYSWDWYQRVNRCQFEWFNLSVFGVVAFS